MMSRFSVWRCLAGSACILIFGVSCSATGAVPETPAASPTSVPTPLPTVSALPASPTSLPTPVALPPSPAAARPTATQTPQPLPEHRIAIRVVDGKGEFFDRQSGETFIPRGTNYIRIAEQTGYGGGKVWYHSTFNPGLYDRTLAQETLSQMHQDGYNVVRVFLNHCCPQGSIGDPAGWLSAAYMDNVADFLGLAQANQVFVIFTIDGVPGTASYIKIFDKDWSQSFGGTNSDVLRAGGVSANARFWSDFISELLARQAPVESIFSYQLRNELFFEANAPPLSLKTGRVQTANGQRYDMASPEERQRMMDEGLVHWIDTIRSGILKADPSALVSVGFFWPQEPHPARVGDPRWIRTYPAIWDSTADFIDLHIYPDAGLTLAQYVDNFEMAGMEARPIIVGEFGVSTGAVSSASRAARILHDWQVQSCDYGFDGWLTWTWDYNTHFYSTIGHEGVINLALSPVSRPDPCQP
jgi:hypothetical protein